MRMTLMSAAATFALVACTPPAETPAPTPEPAAPVVAAPTNAEEATAQDTCGASQYAAMVGAQIAAATFPEGVRTIAPDSVVTQDFRADRLNVLVDASGVITGFQCY